MGQQVDPNVKPKGSGGKKVIIAVVIVLLVAIIGGMSFVIYTLLGPKPQTQAQLDRDNKAGLVVGNEGPQTDERDAEFTTEMNMDWVFPDGSSPSNNAIVANNKKNQRDIYFDLSLSDDPNAEIIYTSPVLPVGTKLQELKLDKPLEKGEYEAKCKFHLLDEEGNETTSVTFGVNLVILN